MVLFLYINRTVEFLLFFYLDISFFIQFSDKILSLYPLSLYVKNIAYTIFYVTDDLTINSVKDDTNSPNDITINKVILPNNFPHIKPSKDLIINELQDYTHDRKNKKFQLKFLKSNKLVFHHLIN